MFLPENSPLLVTLFSNTRVTQPNLIANCFARKSISRQWRISGPAYCNQKHTAYCRQKLLSPKIKTRDGGTGGPHGRRLTTFFWGTFAFTILLK